MLNIAKKLDYIRDPQDDFKTIWIKQTNMDFAVFLLEQSKNMNML